MSALTDPMGFKLATLVEAQRGMTESEVLRYLVTGELPDLSQPPDEPEIITPPSDAQVLPISVATDWLAGRFTDAVVASGIAFKFNPNQPRDNDGKWTDGTPGIDSPDFPSPSGTENATTAAPVGKKITPAVIYKKHADGATVAQRPDGARMRWDAGAKKFIIESPGNSGWQETARLTKTAAYEDTKVPGRWFEPGDELTQPIQEKIGEKITGTPVKQQVSELGETVTSTPEATPTPEPTPKPKSKVSAKLTPEERAAVKVWQGAGHAKIQEALRNGDTTPEVALLDAAIEKQKPLGERTLYRAVTHNYTPDELLTVGNVFTDPGYMATSKSHPEGTLFENWHHIIISTPADAKGLDIRSGPYDEVLLPRGSRLRIDKVDDTRRREGYTDVYYDVYATLLLGDDKPSDQEVALDEGDAASITPPQTHSGPSTDGQPAAETTTADLVSQGDITLRTLRQSPTVLAALESDGAFKASHGGTGVPSDVILEALARERGFDGAPKIVSKSDVDTAITSGKQPEMLKAFQDPAHVINFVTGKYYGGVGDQGNGLYFSYRPHDFDVIAEIRREEYGPGPKGAPITDEQIAEIYGKEELAELPKLYARRRPKIEARLLELTKTYGQHVIRGTLRDDVEIKSLNDDIRPAQVKYLKQLEDELLTATDPTEKDEIDRWIRVMRDPGRFATATGVQAYYGSTPGEVIVLDRSALLVQNDNDVIVAAAVETHTGAMIALVPTDIDAQRLAVDGGEPADELHTTICYLGQAALIPPEVRDSLIDCVTECAMRLPTIIGEAFAVSAFNPVIAAASGREPCVTTLVSGSLLQRVYDMIAFDAYDVLNQAGVAYPTPHKPWIPHITLVYTDDADTSVFVDRLGSVTYDRVRLAFGGDVYDIPLGDHGGVNDGMLTPQYDDGGDET